MKRSHLFAAIAALVISAGAMTGDLCAQQQQYTARQPVIASPSQAGGMVGMIDMARIMKEHPQLKQVREKAKSDQTGLQNYAKQEQETLKNMVEQLREYNPGSTEYKNLEVQITSRNAQLKAQCQLGQKDLVQAQAREFHTVYSQMVREVEAVATQRGLIMVIQYNGSKINQENPDQVMMEMTKQVVWFNQNLDITDEVMSRINQRMGAYHGSTKQQQGNMQPLNR